MFWYRPGWTTATYTDLSFAPEFDFDPSADPDLMSACNDDLECAYDVFLTHDASLGQDTANTRSEVEDKASILGNALDYWLLLEGFVPVGYYC